MKGSSPEAPVPDHNTASPSQAASPRTIKLRWWSLGALVLVRLVSLALVPVADSSEARYADIGRRMLELGDWITPWFDDDVPFWGKPPLYTWITAGGMGLFGVNALGARVGHFLAGVAVAYLVWDWQRRDHGPTHARHTLALLWGAALFYLCAGAVLTDMALLVGLVMAMRGFWRGLHAPAAQARLEGWLLFAGLGIGLLAGGAASNLFDRLTQGHVTDFLQISRFPVFNVADMAITAGVILLLITLLNGERQQRA